MLTQQQILAFAVYEIRQLLAHQLGNTDADPSVLAAAHLAYVLHNQAEAVLRGNIFDPQQAIMALGEADRLLQTNFQARLSEMVSCES